ncbi:MULTISPECIES: hypothetical protein [unclassified Pseudomonas]|uniref:hypothetical protein n=1 Tax=unclassified Pseudomonas TaxID=196821 RepID=UPI0030DB6F2D
MNDSYQQIITWRRLTDTAAVRYVCFMNLKTALYTVQSTDFFRLPMTTANQAFFDKQLIQLLIEMSPSERSQSYASLIEAMDAHDELFGAPEDNCDAFKS